MNTSRTPDPSGGLRVAVTGASGNLGTRVLDALAAEPAVDALLGISRRAPGAPPPGVRWVETDLGDERSGERLAEAFTGVDAVIHLAWLLQPSRDPLATWATNVLGTQRVLEAVAAADVPVLACASSIAAYGPRHRGAPDEPVDESWPTHGRPTAAYSREKAYVERLLDSFEARHPDVRVVRMRPSFVFQRAAAAAQRRLFAGPFLPNRLLRPGLVPAVPDIPGLRFQAVHAEDVADAFRRALLRPGAGGAYNLAGDGTLTARELGLLLGARPVPVPAGLARGALGAAWRLRLVPVDPELLDTLLWLPRLSTARAREELGWRPAHDGAEAVAELLAGLREGAGGATPPLRRRLPGGRARELATGVGGRP
ncbi:Nucleoside-diphosphate-sugar epimerase [Streptomyces zhaozhouensis]|uniref:Nucleoside-diphosphate-sugar epimerase n=1 Tax=Streptomyces zhaozhouensis TaxID=1300267 RepID=A0A286E7H7_9ACTN|nr:NAD-dependent epimerase/dehydratase family protein [Streptomyces zhaozhouensis]SOD66862.1 Nucleoside-diphosphate-sugar epimerase [Streptomyces zhaozhouensis]